MRPGLTVSLLAHAALLGIGLVAFPEARPFEVEDIQALPVDLIDIAELTDLARGDESSRILPEEAPQPATPVEAELPTPAPAETPADQPVEAARPPEARPEPAPEAEPVSEDVASLPEPAETAEPEAPAEVESAAPAPPVDARLPHRRPKPPRIAPPPPETPAVAEREPEQEFNVDDITALLNKRIEAGGSPDPSSDPQTLGAPEGEAAAAMTQSELAALKARLYSCWTPPLGARGAAALVVTVKITLMPDGSLAGQPELLGVAGVSDPLAQVAAEAAVRAVLECAPFGDILRPEKYALWREITFDFDPRYMLGG